MAGKNMNELTQLIKNDMKPALGVTEPGAIAFAVSTAKKYVQGEVTHILLNLNSGMYKNAYTCGIPNSHFSGNLYAAALGAVAGNPNKGLEALADVTQQDNQKASELVDAGVVEAKISEISSRIYIEATVTTSKESATVVIRDSHTNIVSITVNGQIVYRNKKDECKTDGMENEPIATIHKYTLHDIYDYIQNVDYSEISFILDAHEMNMELFNEGLCSDRTTFLKYLKKENGDMILSKNENRTASLLCNGAIEARVLGLDKPAMSITGSGAHGIIATLPLYAVVEINNMSQEALCRATALSYLICMYIKEYSGKLSAFCGCGIAAGTGMACGLVYLYGGGIDAMIRCINNMASGITGMICDGGNHGCAMKGVVAVDAAFRSAHLACSGVSISSKHGINGMTPEDTMKNMGLIASPGMTATEKTIVEIMQNK